MSKKQNRLNSSPTPDRILRLPEVAHLTGFNKSSIYRLMLKGRFPRAVKTGERAVGWHESTVQTWIANRVTA